MELFSISKNKIVIYTDVKIEGRRNKITMIYKGENVLWMKKILENF